MVVNTGTYLDCPFHRFADGKDFAAITLDYFTDLEGLVVRVPHNETLEITEKHFEEYQVNGRAVLVHTGWDQYWNTDQYFENHPFLTKEAAEYLLDQGAALVGTGGAAFGSGAAVAATRRVVVTWG